MNLFAVLVASSTLALSSGAASSDKPRLVVVVGVDQLIPEQLDRLAPFFKGGYGRFVRDGLFYRAAMLEHANTETGPGYATLGTGCHPNRHGVISNAWFKTDSTGYVYCVGDPEVPVVMDSGILPTTQGGVSPRNIRVPGLGDWMKLEDESSLVVSLAGKDRAAIGMGGERPDLCLWWNKQQGGFMSSAWYCAELPEWVVSQNAGFSERAFDSSWGIGWTLDLPDGIEKAGTASDDRLREAPRSRVDDLLKAGRAESVESMRRKILAQAGYSSPLADLFTIEMARLAVEHLGLGQDDHPDLLSIGLSGCDVAGHAYGPYSAEVTDLLLRGDLALGELFDFLDDRIGSDAWIAVLASDHGVLMLPEEARRRGLNATRVYNPALRKFFEGVRSHSVETFGEDFIFSVTESGVRLDVQRIEAANLSPATVRTSLARWVIQNCDWMERVFTFDELELESDEIDPWLWLAQRCHDSERSPDLAFQLRPWTLAGFSQGTSHGSPYPYDRSIPIVFLGSGIEAGRRFDRASTADIAPTILHCLGIESPDSMDGRPLDLR